MLTLSSQIYCHKSFSDLNKPTPWSSIRNIVRIPEVKLWLTIELKSSNFQSTVLLNFIPEFENLEIFSPAASLILKNIHQTLKRNSELHFNDLNCKSCLRNLQIKASRIAWLKTELYCQIASRSFTCCKNPKFFACGGLGALDSLVPCRPLRENTCHKNTWHKNTCHSEKKKNVCVFEYVFFKNTYLKPLWLLLLFTKLLLLFTK